LEFIQGSRLIGRFGKTVPLSQGLQFIGMNAVHERIKGLLEPLVLPQFRRRLQDRREGSVEFVFGHLQVACVVIILPSRKRCLGLQDKVFDRIKARLRRRADVGRQPEGPERNIVSYSGRGRRRRRRRGHRYGPLSSGRTPHGQYDRDPKRQEEGGMIPDLHNWT